MTSENKKGSAFKSRHPHEVQQEKEAQETGRENTRGVQVPNVLSGLVIRPDGSKVAVGQYDAKTDVLVRAVA